MDIAKLQRLKDDLEHFAKNFLVIKTKNQGNQLFNLNDIQRDFHNRIEKRKKAGKPCKYVVVKARQLGLSTYIEARLFHKVLFEKAKNAFILGDKAETANSIFDMARRYYDNLPEALQLKLLGNSAKALKFETDSMFRVGTAQANVIARGTTNNYFHGSEVGFWENATEIVSGILQTIPENNDSEIFLESTTNGTTGKGLYFYEMAMVGMDDKSEFQTVFYPWFKNPEYQKSLVEPIKYDEQEKYLVDVYNLTVEQIFWRRTKLQNEFKKREHLFVQEYPSNIHEAFLKNDNSLIPVEYLERAKKQRGITGNGAPIVVGVDPARSNDRTVITIRQGRVVHKFYKFEAMTNTQLAGYLTRIAEAINPSKIFIDYGYGVGTYDLLVQQGMSGIVELVQFGEHAYDKRKYVNRRAEMYDKMRDWFIQEGGVYIKDSEYIDEFERDIAIIPDLEPGDSNGRLGLKSKKDIVKGTEINSVDFADSLALTFASPVRAVQNEEKFSQASQLVRVINNNWQER